MIECVFCGIVQGDLPATIVFETDDVLAFLDIRPVARGHIVVVPKLHAADLDSLDPTLGAALFAAGHRLSRALRRSDLSTDGANLVVNGPLSRLSSTPIFMSFPGGRVTNCASREGSSFDGCANRRRPRTPSGRASFACPERVDHENVFGVVSIR